MQLHGDRLNDAVEPVIQCDVLHWEWTRLEGFALFCHRHAELPAERCDILHFLPGSIDGDALHGLVVDHLATASWHVSKPMHSNTSHARVPTYKKVLQQVLRERPPAGFGFLRQLAVRN